MPDSKKGEYAKLTTVLPSQSAIFARKPVQPGGWAYTYQRSYLPYLSVEFARLGARQIALRPDDPSARELKQLPEGLARCVEIVDPERKVSQRVSAYMAPILAEVPVETDLGGFLRRGPKDRDPRTIDAVAMMGHALTQVALGVEYGLQIDLDLEVLKANLEHLGGSLRGYESRKNTADFMGVLNSYAREEVDSICFVSKLEKKRVDEFLEVLDDAAYRELSDECFKLGIPGKIRAAVERIKKLARKVSRNRRQAIAVGTTAVGLATAGKLKLDPALVGDLLPRGPEYLPPIVSYAHVREEAVRQFRKEQQISHHPKELGDQVIFIREKKLYTEPRQLTRSQIDELVRELGAKPITPEDEDKD